MSTTTVIVTPSGVSSSTLSYSAVLQQPPPLSYTKQKMNMTRINMIKSQSGIILMPKKLPILTLQMFIFFALESESTSITFVNELVTPSSS